MANKTIPKDTLVIVATGAEAKVFRNRSDAAEVKLESAGSLSPQDLLNDGPSGVRPPESSRQETDEATFAKQLAEHLYQQAHAGNYSHLILVADPDTLGELRPILHQEVTNKMLFDLDKTLINSSTEDIETSLSNANW